ncbi:MAG: DNA replication and repair protein RecF [Candidatus Dependentiae bacterium]|nr:DNA replication and repair protein RecF [Candidatus Dependentiae bacterium]
MYKRASEIVCSELYIKNFRCFKDLTLKFDNSVVLLEGINGAGKTSILEALYYACYLRSFRTHLPKELISFDQEHFFVRIQIQNNNNDHEIQVGFSHDKRSVKIDKKAISSYKELMAHYRVVSLIEDDVNLIKGGPQERRSFIDQTILLLDASLAVSMKEFRKVLSNRTSLIQQLRSANDNYWLWTHQLWERSQEIQKKRTALLALLMEDVHELVRMHFDDNYEIACTYEPKLMKENQTFQQFVEAQPHLFEHENTAKRSLFGAHLDDFVIKLQNKKTKRLASRGQQKLILLLLKIAQAHYIATHSGPLLLLLDDFMTDFDHSTVQKLLSILYSLKSQLIFTSPITGSILSSEVSSRGAQLITVTHSIKEAYK